MPKTLQKRKWIEGTLTSFGLLVAAIWVGSLFADMGIYPLAHDDPHVDTGWILLKYGWLGPLVLSVGWYGNFLLLICVAVLLRGRAPSLKLATTSLGIAASSLLPIVGLDPRWDVPWSLVRGPAVWLWLACFVVAWLPSAYIRWLLRENDTA